jgi:hypothetical protein
LTVDYLCSQQPFGLGCSLVKEHSTSKHNAGGPVCVDGELSTVKDNLKRFGSFQKLTYTWISFSMSPVFSRFNLN